MLIFTSRSLNNFVFLSKIVFKHTRMILSKLLQFNTYFQWHYNFCCISLLQKILDIRGLINKYAKFLILWVVCQKSNCHNFCFMLVPLFLMYINISSHIWFLVHCWLLKILHVFWCARKFCLVEIMTKNLH